MNIDFSDIIKTLEIALEGLKLAQNSAISFRLYTSPLEPLIEITIDLLIKLSFALKMEGIRAFPTPNPELTFTEREQDALGNPKQYRNIKLPPIIGPQPFSSEVMRMTAQYLVSLKRCFQVSFDRKFWEPSVASGRLDAMRILLKNMLKHQADLTAFVKAEKRKKYSTSRRLYLKKNK